ncbi:MAG TPA: pepsin-like aspartic protease [Polyangiaceae bacterium]
MKIRLSSRFLSLASTLALLGTAGCGGSEGTNNSASNEPDSGQPSTGDAAVDAHGDARVEHDAASEAGEDAGPTGVVSVPLSSCVPTVYTLPGTIGGSQMFQLVLDTGSTSLGVAGMGCSCGGVSPVYTPGPTAVDQKQMASSQFGSGSWSGEIYQDSVALGSSQTAPTKLVSIASQTSFFEPLMCDSKSGGMQGLVGFGPSAAAVSGTNGFFDQYVATNHVPDVFATELCETTGTLWLGGFDATATTAAPQYTPLAADVSSTYYYTVNLASITVGGTTVPVGSGGQLPDSVVDTGTSVFILNANAYNGLTAALEGDAMFKQLFGATFFPAVNSQNTACQTLSQTKAQLDAALPELTLTFGSNPGVSVKAVATESYLFNYGGQWCSSLFGADSNTIGPLAGIMGSPVLRSNVVIFDRAQKRIGFAPHAPCP